MPSTLPDGAPAPADGTLPPASLARLGSSPLGAYVHVPYCATRCGYCDFNTYTAAELGPGVSRATWADSLTQEVALARRVLGAPAPPLETVFYGGGTPTLLEPAALVSVLAALRDAFGLAEGAEVTTEANPDSVGPEALSELRRGGFTRVSFGMQSAVPHVLATLDRVHTPGRAGAAVAEARAAGFEHLSVDLIYGAPGETLADWAVSLEAALACEPDHVSAYALIVEDGTRLAARVRRGELAAPDDDYMADAYALADATLTAAGYECYELSNWARPGGRCRHNELYWRGADWWGFGPGAHSHVGGTRWWNVKHPAAWAGRLESGQSPAAARELLSAEDQRVERILLETRLSAGLPLEVLAPQGARAARGFVDEGLLRSDAWHDGRAALTLRGRLLADAVVRDLVD
ncbi:oxygen-independent coproporphyrinogen-3 oxidase [Motilibacter peucedani]|uniref:Heme chaperone HemW n=1 Tax=Motilibacter peucedani TaxID=598650 RepID=A0A420XNW7_9ACTN|nr:radical SAM family heme chaperone HemW [Motilibacter peucedani]RKS73884.1 oxygen-independent coproporphyrinogen-3 oxidase [Motilibacter peucedani]